ncbi:hypothetical protein BN1708_019591 [Verticillium longisporum]|uniref:Uncharacterized protein n=1 Tax=Verticillium longisporum TaxID=100787 RepID=A0A0G4MKM2_VERLO|nr:hypothetical protein BN1708_019591 [Verticillium longisporum]
MISSAFSSSSSRRRRTVVSLKNALVNSRERLTNYRCAWNKCPSLHRLPPPLPLHAPTVHSLSEPRLLSRLRALSAAGLPSRPLRRSRSCTR